MRFLIAPSEDVMSVDNAVANIALDANRAAYGLAANIDFVVWGSAGGGEIAYNDRLAVHEPFTDPRPYESALNGWLLVMMNATPPLQLSQARRIKTAFIDGIYEALRQSPINVFGNVWDASDEQYVDMQAVIARWDVAAAASGSVAYLVASVNGMTISTPTITTPTITSSAQGLIDMSYVASLTVRTDGTVSQINNATAKPSSHASGISSQSGPIYSGQISHSEVTAPPVAGPPVTWMNIDGTLVNIDFPSMQILIGTISARRAQLQQARAAKKIAVSYLTTIPDIIAYYAGGGWPI